MTLAQTQLDLIKMTLRVDSLKHRLSVVKAINNAHIDPWVKQSLLSAAMIVDDTASFADNLNTDFGIKV